MSHRRKIRDADEALAALDAIARAGCDRVAWARAHNIDPRSLNAWRVNLSRGSRQPLRIVELVADIPRDRPRPGGQPAFTIRFGDFAVEVGADVEEGTLVRVLRAVRAC